MNSAVLRVLLDFLKRKLAPLDYDNLRATAARRSGLDDFGEPISEEALRILVTSCNTEANLSMFGQFAARRHLLDLLETRLKLVNRWQLTPEMHEQSIRRPLFITGLPRSGSTFLHGLFAQDPENRVPVTWEVMFPFPSRNNQKLGLDQRVAKAENQLRWLRLINPSITKAHPIGACLPQECIAIMSYSFLSDEFLCMFRVPSYEKWLRTQDMTPAYRFHCNFLKHLQSLRPGKRWVLKAPDHVHSLEDLFKIYCDADVVFLHRDPMKVLGSVASLSKLLWSAFSREVDPCQVGAEESRILEEKVRKIIEFQERHSSLSGHCINIRYSDLVRDPMKTVGGIYVHFGLNLSVDAERRMRDFLESKRNKGRLKHIYRIEDFGLDPNREIHRFSDYYKRFDVEREPL